MISETRSGTPRDIVVLGVDGLGFELARECWPGAATTEMRSVFPTTSAASWLSSLTGRSVAEHRVPGVVFALDEQPRRLVNVFKYQGTGLLDPHGTVFTDAIAAGYQARSIPSDLEPLSCTWREELLRGSRRVSGYRFYPCPDGRYQPQSPAEIRNGIRAAIAVARDDRPAGRPCFVWCFVEVDRHVHEKGYDAHVHQVLAGLDKIARDLADDGVVVVAHADHGLVPTRHSPGLSKTLETLRTRIPFQMGGAGRIRWLYTEPGTAPRLRRALRESLPGPVRVARAEEMFPLEVRSRVGEVLLIATGEEFLTETGYRYDHGSATEAECRVPFSVWDAGSSSAAVNSADWEGMT
jgi:hypothetical protein